MLVWSAAAPAVCTALAPWMATAQIVLRSAIFLIRKGPLRPPVGSAAPARRGRARGPWGTYYYDFPSRWRRLGPVARGARADSSTHRRLHNRLKRSKLAAKTNNISLADKKAAVRDPRRSGSDDVAGDAHVLDEGRDSDATPIAIAVLLKLATRTVPPLLYV